MIVHNDCNRKGKALILTDGFLKRDYLVSKKKSQEIFTVKPGQAFPSLANK